MERRDVLKALVGVAVAPTAATVKAKCPHAGSVISLTPVYEYSDAGWPANNGSLFGGPVWTVTRNVKPDTLWRCEDCKSTFRADSLPPEWQDKRYLYPTKEKGKVG